MASTCDPVSKMVVGYDHDKPAEASWEDQRHSPSAVTISISALQYSDSPRLDGENADHVRALAESEVDFPPIIVNRSTMRVIDGMHRLRATLLRGQDDIAARFFEGDERDAFLLAVEANIKHGLPLSLADRIAAASRIVTSHPQLSDRAIASSTGLAARTVSTIRRRTTAENPQLNARVGRDGRIRPLSAAEGRRIAAELIVNKPNASLREIAGAAGISVGTARDVRERIRSGNNPVPQKQHENEQLVRQRDPTAPLSQCSNKLANRTSAENRSVILEKLRKDPSVRLTEAGRTIIHLLKVLAVGTDEWERLIHNLPPHCAHTVSDAARACAQLWQEFANQLAGNAATTVVSKPK